MDIDQLEFGVNNQSDVAEVGTSKFKARILRIVQPLIGHTYRAEGPDSDSREYMEMKTMII